jgi:hypothetical protein
MQAELRSARSGERTVKRRGAAAFVRAARRGGLA